ncbi:MAG: thiol:disulfide interchange protein DsbA/DsbL [Betaproteobacteria bacterium]|nr:thiol:disulfide interchange protein DsbA/DsbL [Betaproteobacteria bacterium]
MKRLLSLIVLAAALALPAQARAAEPGKDYLVISPSVPVDVKKGQVEVLEFFWYRCPHCFDLETELKAWTAKLPKGVVFRQVPGILNPNWATLARAYYAMEAIGVLDKLHHEVFDAIHVHGQDLNSPQRFLDWAAGKGVNRKQLADAFDSFAVNTKVMRAQQLTNAYRLNGVPAFAINGKFVTSASLTGGNTSLFKILDELIARELGRGGNK